MSFLGGLLHTKSGHSRATLKSVSSDILAEAKRMRSRRIDRQYVWLCLGTDDLYSLTFGPPDTGETVDCGGVTAWSEMEAFIDAVDAEYIANDLLSSVRSVRRELRSRR